MAKMYYTAEETASKLGITAEDLTAYVRDQRLRVFKDGERDMYMVSEVDGMAPVTAANVPDIDLAPAPDGVDLKVFGDTTGNYWMYDASLNRLQRAP